MNHQPFETWLLDDKVLTLTEKRELDTHLRECKNCTALAETGLALRSARVVAPATGFALRFQQKLALQKAAEQRRRLIGLIIFVLCGVGLAGWFAAPFLISVVTSPVEWLISAANIFLFVYTSSQAFGEIAAVILRMIPDFLPPYMWMVLFSGLAGMGLLWAVSIWRFARRNQGVPA